jgi:hypothetical protein
MNLSDSDKLTVLLKLRDDQINEISRRRGLEQKWFEWSSSLLLAAFGAVVALSNRANPLPYSIVVKFLATVLILVPTSISSYRIIREKEKSVGNAESIEHIQELLRVYEENVYGTASPYPKEWIGRYARGMKKRQTPIFYSYILIVMGSCVAIAIWLIL